MRTAKVEKVQNFALLGQSGAIFGMDARIALIIASILAATGGITMMSRLDRGKVDLTERHLVTLQEAILDDYANNQITQLTPELSLLVENQVLTDPTVLTDAWGNNWQYFTLDDVVSIEGTKVTMHYAVLYSGGKDGVPDSNQPFSGADFATWEPMNDDLGIKISTRDVELNRLEEYRARGQLIVGKLESYESSQYLEGTGTCGNSEAPEWCADFEGKNHTQFNYYPPSDADTVEGVAYFAKAAGEGAVYQSGNVDDMQQLLIDIGLPAEYATDPWGRTLFYHSNVTERENPPFTASICFSNGGSCF